jgi:lipopolysaccharide export system protein LptA
VSSTLVSAAQPPEQSPTLPDIVITSNSLVFKNHENTALFEGKVVMTKGNFVMRADQMIVHFAGESSSSPSSRSGKANASPQVTPADLPTFGNRSVSLIDATGNVMMQQGDKKAKSRKAVYHQRDEMLVLTGDPEVWEEGYRVTGSKMTMFLREDRSIVEGSRVVINDTESKPR